MRLRHAPGLRARPVRHHDRATRQAHVSRALHIALTAGGMRALGVAESVIDGFSAEFIAGMAGDEGRSRRLGDVGASAPSLWRWGGRAGAAHAAHAVRRGEPGRVARSDRSGPRQWPCRARPAAHDATWAARSRSASSMASASRDRLVRRTRAGHDGRPRLRQSADRGRIPAGLSQRVRPLYRPATARSGTAGSGGTADRRGRSRAARSGPQRQLSGDARTCPGRPGILAFHRGAGSRRRRCGDSAGAGDGGAADVRRCAGSHARAADPRCGSARTRYRAQPVHL